MTLTLTNVLPLSKTTPRTRITGSDTIRRRALDRLYRRKAAVNELIDCLENYQRCRETMGADCIPFTAMPKCS